MKVFILLIVGAILFPAIANAGVVNCGKHYIGTLMVQGNREGTHGHENKLIVKLQNDSGNVACDGKTYVYIDNADPAYAGTVSAMLSAQAQDKKVEVWVNTSVVSGGNAVEIAWVTLHR